MTSVLIQGDRGLVVRRFHCAADARRAQAPIESDGIGAALVRRVCSWCQADMGVVPGLPEQAGQVTHGLCGACEQRLLAELPGVPHPRGKNLVSGGGLEGSGAPAVLGSPSADAAPSAPSPSPALPGADVVAAGRVQGHAPDRVNGTANPAEFSSCPLWPAGSGCGAEHASGGPAATSAPPRGLFWTVTGADFGRVIRWAKNHWRNPLDALVRDKINQIKETKKS